ncbi:hypothetical protein BBJ28_00006608 [Nothophytophthora sp. Chile5]|nr:hypothetical protein BBJ28_00006608 [Nothophytophthora sp. Chile5]
MGSTDEREGRSRRRRRRRPDSAESHATHAEATADPERGSSARRSSGRTASLTPQARQLVPLETLSLASQPIEDQDNAEANAVMVFSSEGRRHTGKRRASGERAYSAEETKADQAAPRGQMRQLVEVEEAGLVHRGSRRSRRSTAASARATVAPPARPISNATRNITFAMLQPHFERPLQQAADSFGVCTTLLKKICRRNGISNWPYRKICGLRKSIASMAKQVNYFDGEQKRAYADQLDKLQRELEAYLRTGSEVTEAFERILDAEVAAAEAARSSIDMGEGLGDEEEKDAEEAERWTSRPSILQPRYSEEEGLEASLEPPTVLRRAVGPDEIAEERQRQLRGPPLQPPPVFLTIATHHRALPSIASILQHQSYSSPSRAASTHSSGAAARTPQYPESQQQQQWTYFPPANDDAV